MLKTSETTTDSISQGLRSQQDTLISTPSEQGRSTTVSVDTNCSPYYDRGLRTRTWSIIGLISTWVFAVASIVFGILVQCQGWRLLICKETGAQVFGAEMLVLAQNIVITVCSDSVGYIHSLSLRWSLLRSRKLDFNSNLRLFQRSTGPNAWYSNLIVSGGIIVTYGASAMTLQADFDDCTAFRILGTAWIILGCGLAVQAAVASWAVSDHHNWPTWSSDAMDVAAACVCYRMVLHRPGRGMQGLDQHDESPRPNPPLLHQPAAFRSHKQIRRVLSVMWVIVSLLVIYIATLFIYLLRRYSHWVAEGRLNTSDFWFSLESDASTMIGILLSNAALNSDGSRWLPQDFAWVFTLLCGLQALITLPLHCAELCINSCRDETIWRRASSRQGLRRTSNALVMFLTSWQSMSLFLLKPFAHWVYSLTLKINIYTGIMILPAQVCYLTIIITALASLCLAMSLWTYDGPQPSTFGHLQTMVDLIDLWPEKDERMFWGDKGAIERDSGKEWQPVIRHAGISAQALSSVHMSEAYQ